MLPLILSRHNKTTLFRTLHFHFRSPSYKMSTVGNSKVNNTLIIEQTNPLESESKAKYDISIGTTTFNEFILSYPSGAYTGMRTVERDSIVEFDTHIQRIVKAVSTIAFKVDDSTKNIMESFSDIEQLKAKTVPLLKKGLQTYYDQVDTTKHSEHPAETKVSIMVTYSPEKHLPLFAAHFSQLLSLPKDKRVKVEIKQALRTAPEVKDSQWVRERATLEKNMPKDCNEVILSDDKNQLYEGMSSNFLTVKLVNDKPVVMCAGLEYILLGTILKIIISICKKHDIAVEWDFPKIEDLKEGKWIGCFIASTSRLLLPVETVYVDDQRIEFKESAPIIEFLRSEVLKEIYNTSFKIL